MNGYLMDTNICIFAFRGEHGIIERMKQYGKSQCYVSDITVWNCDMVLIKVLRLQRICPLLIVF